LIVVVAGGGTGGHLYPGLAVARELQRQRPDARISFAGTARGLEARVVPREGFELDLIRSAGLKGKSVATRARGALLLAPSFWDAWRIVSRRKPHVVVGVGGYSSGPVVLAEDALGAAAADVDHQPPVLGAGGQVRDAHVDQACLLAAGDHFDGMAQRFAGLEQESLGVVRLAQRAGADGAHAAGRHHAQALAETLQALQGALDGALCQPLRGIEPVGQRDALAQPVEHHELPVDVLGDNHVETVRTQIDGRDGLVRA
jgi:hypothetical protein